MGLEQRERECQDTSLLACVLDFVGRESETMLARINRCQYKNTSMSGATRTGKDEKKDRKRTRSDDGN